MVYNILHVNFNDLRMSQERLVTVGPSTTAYAITLLMFISITIITLTNHLRGRHDTCRRNLVVSALLASVIMAVSSFRLPVPPAVQTLETVAYLTMLLTSLLLMLSVLIELNNQTGGAVKKRHETTAAGLRNMPAHGPATSPYRNEPGPATTYSRQEKRTDQPHTTQVPAQKPIRTANTTHKHQQTTTTTQHGEEHPTEHQQNNNERKHRRKEQASHRRNNTLNKTCTPPHKTPHTNTQRRRQIQWEGAQGASHISQTPGHSVYLAAGEKEATSSNRQGQTSTIVATGWSGCGRR
jgi:hypothetical protein